MTDIKILNVADEFRKISRRVLDNLKRDSSHNSNYSALSFVGVDWDDDNSYVICNFLIVGYQWKHSPNMSHMLIPVYVHNVYDSTIGEYPFNVISSKYYSLYEITLNGLLEGVDRFHQMEIRIKERVKNEKQT